MIYTVTLNPAIDYFMGFDKVSLGEMNIAHTGYSFPGGKGINISRVLKNFGVDSIAMGFVGGFTGDYIEAELIQLGIKTDFVKINDISRINIQVNSKDSETEFAGKPPFISEEEKNKFLEKFSMLKSGDILILSGSIPKSLGEDFYKIILENIPANVIIFLDARGEGLKHALPKKVFLIKPNHKELEEIFDRTFNNMEEIIVAGKELQKNGAQNVLISLGENGSVLITQDKVFKSDGIRGEIVSTIGAGDSMVAGIVYGLTQNKNLVDCYKFAVASGTATVFSVGLATKEKTESILQQLSVSEYF